MALVFALVGFYQYETQDHLREREAEPQQHLRGSLPRQLRLLRPVDLRTLPRRRADCDRGAHRPRRDVAAARGLAALAFLAVAWLGLLISFSQSSFAALLVAVFALAVVVWRWKSLFALAAVLVVAAAVAVAQPKLMHSLRHHTTSGLNHATSGRATLIAVGIKIARAHPSHGVGLGGFEHAYSKREGKKPKQSASHNTPVTVAAEEGGPGLAHLLLARRSRCSSPPTGGSTTARYGLSALAAGLALARDLRPLARVQRLLRGSDHLGAVRPDRARLAGARAGTRGPTRGDRRRARACDDRPMIEQWKKALVLAPHTDDGEFGCGGTMARLVEAGCDVRYVAFSIATRSLPPGFPPDTLAKEVREATAELGIPDERAHRPRLRRPHVPRAAAGHPRAARRALGGVAARRRLPAEPPRRPPGSPHGRRGGPPRLQAHDDPRLRDPVEQLRLRVPVVRRARGEARRAQGRGARAVRLTAAPPLRERRVRPQPRAHARRQREPRVRRGLPGLPRRRLSFRAPLPISRGCFAFSVFPPS